MYEDRMAHDQESYKLQGIASLERIASLEAILYYIMIPTICYMLHAICYVVYDIWCVVCCKLYNVM